MKVEQIAEIVNDLSKEFLGTDTPVEATDVSKIVDVGRETFNSTADTSLRENYVRKLLDHIGKVKFVNRPYTGRAPSVLMDGWEFGSILEKIDAGIPEADVNKSWDLNDGEVYEQDKFTAPKDVSAKFWNDRVTFEVPMSFADRQVKSAFSNINQLNGFFSMLQTKIHTSLTIKNDALIMSTINNFIANSYTANKGVNLLAKYKTLNPSSQITAATAMYDLDFIKFCAYQLKLYSNRLTNASTVFNIGGKVRHTPVELQKIIMLDAFSDAADVYLQSDTFHNELTKLPNADRISFWQYSGSNYDFEDVSSINITPATSSGVGSAVKISGVIAAIFDHEALGVNNYDRRVTAHYNNRAEFSNNWYKMDAQYFNDFNENFVFFYIAD